MGNKSHLKTVLIPPLKHFKQPNSTTQFIIMHGIHVLTYVATKFAYSISDSETLNRL